MSYLENRITRDEFIMTRGAERSQALAKISLNLFDYFCKGEITKEEYEDMKSVLE